MSNGSVSPAQDSMPLSVYGPVGVVDLLVPRGSSAADVVREYSRQANLPPSTPPYTLVTRLGSALRADQDLAEAGIGTGAVLVALAPGDPWPAPVSRRTAGRAEAGPSRGGLAPGALSVLWVLVSGAAAALAGWCAASLPEDSDRRLTAVIVLAAVAVVGALPIGPLAEHRVLGVPAFAGAAAFAVVWDPEPVRLPSVLGIAALVAALGAALALALGRAGESGLRVWVAAGVGVFAVTGAATLLDLDPVVVWSVLFIAAVLAARFVPVLAVDVPDQYLLDLDRLAVTAWSAREQPGARAPGRRGRIVVPPGEVADVAARGTQVVTACAAAVLVVVSVSAWLLLAGVPDGVQAVGARCEVGFGAAALLLAARDYRHLLARALLRAAGLAALVVLAADLLPRIGEAWTVVIGAASILLALVLLAVAVAVGRGWRSAWWSRRAEWSETAAGAFALAAVVPAIGVFEVLWKSTS